MQIFVYSDKSVMRIGYNIAVKLCM